MNDLYTIYVLNIASRKATWAGGFALSPPALMFLHPGVPGPGAGGKFLCKPNAQNDSTFHNTYQNNLADLLESRSTFTGQSRPLPTWVGKRFRGLEKNDHVRPFFPCKGVAVYVIGPPPNRIACKAHFECHG